MQLSASLSNVFLLVFQNSRVRDGPSITAKISQLDLSNRLLDPEMLPDIGKVQKEEMLVSVGGVLVTARLVANASPAQIVRLAECSVRVDSSSQPGAPRYVTVQLDTVPLSVTHQQLAFVLEMLRGQIMDYPIPIEVLTTHSYCTRTSHAHIELRAHRTHTAHLTDWYLSCRFCGASRCIPVRASSSCRCKCRCAPSRSTSSSP